jgi:hypothetical protein
MRGHRGLVHRIEQSHNQRRHPPEPQGTIQALPDYQRLARVIAP